MREHRKWRDQADSAQNTNVPTVDIEIKGLGLWVSNTKVPSSVCIPNPKDGTLRNKCTILLRKKNKA